ncbi:glycerophosphodiester phosphodiesterase [Turicibacter sp. KK003]|uniref:glycerophosphodiester phosphodiesterase n=1 Tax=Turicibacter sp. KK003 TaxID=3114695 RepID=UPI0030CF6237
MINFAHRGASGDYPENTLLAFKEGIKRGGNGIELDVHKTKDSELVVIHDEDVERTMQSKGLIKDLTLAEIRQLKCKKALFANHEECRIPTLDEVLKLVKDQEIVVNIELKTDVISYSGIEEDVIKLIQHYGIKNKTLISSFNPQSLKKCKEIDSTIKTGFLYYQPMEQIIEYAKTLRVDAIHPHLKLVTKDLIEKAHQNQLDVNVYTVNSPIHMRELIRAEVDGIFTDYPSLLNEIIEENKLKSLV